MSIYIKPEFQIQRINHLENRLNSWDSLSPDEWRHRPDSKSWSAIEVVQHMFLAHKVYRDKIEGALAKEASTEVLSEYKAAAIPGFLIKRFPPNEGRIRFKMKTMKQFKPVLAIEQLNAQDIQNILSDMSDALTELKTWAERYRTQSISMKKFNSAIGATVRFNVPEACEFVLCHNERHFLQIDRALAN